MIATRPPVSWPERSKKSTATSPFARFLLSTVSAAAAIITFSTKLACPPFVSRSRSRVRFTEPLEDYRHQHQTPRTENGIEYGDQMKYLNFAFMGNVARSNAEALRQLALAPAPPTDVKLSGGISPDAKLAWSSADDPGRAGFEILWRETTEYRWAVYDFIAAGQEAVLKGVSTDNHFFAVRAVGRNGARSIAVSTSTGRNLPF